VSVTVDSREAVRNQWIVKQLRRALKVEVKALPLDYLLANKLFVERKAVLDYAQSLKGRIIEQLEAMKALMREGYEALLLVEGSWGVLKRFSRMSDRAVMRMTDAILLKWGVPVLYSPNKSATVAWIIAKARSMVEGERRQYPLRFEKKPREMADVARFVLEGVPGVSAVLAKRLLAELGSLRAVANASMEELMAVEGVGREKARKIWEVFNYSSTRSSGSRTRGFSS